MFEPAHVGTATWTSQHASRGNKDRYHQAKHNETAQRKSPIGRRARIAKINDRRACRVCQKNKQFRAIPFQHRDTSHAHPRAGPLLALDISTEFARIGDIDLRCNFE